MISQNHKCNNNCVASQQKAAVPFCVIRWTSSLLSGLIVLSQQQDESKMKAEQLKIEFDENNKNQHRSFIAVVLIFYTHSFDSSKAAISQFKARDNRRR